MRTLTLTSGGRGGFVVLASGLGDHDTGGGLFAFDGSSLDTIDRLSTTGLCAAGGELFRLLRNSAGTAGEILIYDSRGVKSYHRVDQLADPHDVAWDGRHLLAVSTSTNTILWIARSGEVVRSWKAPGEGDCWHLNGLALEDGAVLACAFGRYGDHREWKSRLRRGDGLVFDIHTGKTILSGLCGPHTPRRMDGSWLICNSELNELLEIDARDGAVRRRAALRGWTRGLAVTDDLILVGESAPREQDIERHAKVAVLSRHDWTVLERIPLPCREIYDLLLVPEGLAVGARTGFRTNPLRVADHDQLWMFQQAGRQPARLWATGDAVPREHCRVRVQADFPQQLAPGQTASIPCRLTNVGGAFLVSAPPHPVHFAYKWYPASGGEYIEGQRTRLPRTLPPGDTLACELQVEAPPRAGVYELRVTLVQEAVAWFDDLDPANRCAAVIHIGESSSDAAG